MIFFSHWILAIFALCLHSSVLSTQLSLLSTESDPDAFVQNSVNVINGDYCESATDLMITGPDALILQRFYNTKDVITGTKTGGWRIFPQRFLVIGKDPSQKSCHVGKEKFEWAFAFVGERSGAILPYSGWRNVNGLTKDPLKMDIVHDALGAVNTYAKEINGQTNHQNNQLHCKEDTCELTLGDGTRRIYQRVQALPSKLLGEELTPMMAAEVLDPVYFVLTKETLPSGNQIFFSYDETNHLTSVEMKNPAGKLFSWIHFSYEFSENTSQVHIKTSDSRELIYHFLANQLVRVSGSHCISTTYEYDDNLLVKKVLPEGRFVQIAYQEGKVQALKGPYAESGQADTVHSFSYDKDYTDVFDAMGTKTRYRYNKRLELTAVVHYDTQDKLYRMEQKFWGKTRADTGLLLAKTISDGERIYSYRSFQYDKSANVIEERLYGNLTGKQEVSLQVSSDGKLLNADEQECHVKTFGYSADGFNLLTKMGDCKGNQTIYTYKSGTNLLLKKLIYDNGVIKKRTFQHYNEDGVCIQIIEDDGSKEKESDIYGWCVTERQIKDIQPKMTLPGVGLPEVIREKALNLKTRQEILVKKLVNTYDAQSNLLSCDTYDANDEYAFTEKRTYNSLGQIASQIDAMGREVCYTYDRIGNKTSEIHHQVVNGIIVDSQRTKCVYGPMGRLEEEIQAADSPLSKKTCYEYNSLGQLTTKNLSGSPVQYTYNKNGDLHKIEVRNSKKELQISNSYYFNHKGNVTSAQTLHGISVQRSYNPFSQVVREIIKDGEDSYIIEYSYDRKGRLKTITLPDKSKIAYTYDALFGRKVDRISSQGEVLYTHVYKAYDTQGKLLTENHVGYTRSHEYTYNLNGQKIGNKNGIFHEEYVRDALGRITEIKGKKPKNYAYNDLSQLISEGKSIHTYDSLDNRTKIDHESLVYNACNQLLSHANTTFSYDTQGNLLRKVFDGEETRFTSNLLSQLITIEKADKTTLTFSYDPFGRVLVEKHLDCKEKNKKTLSTTRYLYLGYQEIGTLSTTNAIVSLKVLGLDGDALSTKSIAFDIKEETYVPLHDIAGNVVHLINPQNGQVVESYEYTAFGQTSVFNEDGEQENTSPTRNPWQFAEKRIDETSHLVLFGLRFYDPKIGRWISQDPIGNLDGHNLYAYLHNNPIGHFDRFGLTTESDSQNTFEKYMFGEFETHCYCERHRTCKRGGDIGKTAGVHLPKITYNDYFEKYYRDYRDQELYIKDCYENSTCYTLSEDGAPDLPNDLGIGFANGIWNDFKSAKASVQYISRLAGGCNVHAVYNATHGMQVDPVECLMGLNFIATEPVRQLHQMWNSFFEKSSVNARFLMVCHSQGAIHVRNALLDYPPELRERILVVAIAPAAYMYRETCGDVFHYRVAWWRDFVPRLDRDGVKRENNTSITLSSHSSAFVFDHEFMSPTYQEQLQIHIRNYLSSQGKML